MLGCIRYYPESITCMYSFEYNQSLGITAPAPSAMHHVIIKIGALCYETYPGLLHKPEMVFPHCRPSPWSWRHILRWQPRRDGGFWHCDELKLLVRPSTLSVHHYSFRRGGFLNPIPLLAMYSPESLYRVRSASHRPYPADTKHTYRQSLDTKREYCEPNRSLPVGANLLP